MEKVIGIDIEKQWDTKGNSFLISPSRLIPFREQLTADQIIQFIAQNRHFKYKSYLDIEYKPKTLLDLKGIDWIENRNKNTPEWQIDPSTVEPTTVVGDETLIYVSCLRSLAVTWDELAINSYKKLLSLKPGLLTAELIPLCFYRSGFYFKDLFMDLLNEVENGYPEIAYKISGLKRYNLAFLENEQSSSGNFALKYGSANPPEYRQKGNSND